MGFFSLFRRMTGGEHREGQILGVRVPKGTPSDDLGPEPVPGCEPAPGRILRRAIRCGRRRTTRRRRRTLRPGRGSLESRTCDGASRSRRRELVELVRSVGSGAPAGPVWRTLDSARRRFDGFVENVESVQALVERFSRIATIHEQTMQWLILNDSLPNSEAILPPIREAGVNLWSPAKDGGFLVEVERPEGITISALQGTPYPDGTSGESPVRTSRSQPIGSGQEEGDDRSTLEELQRQSSRLDDTACGDKAIQNPRASRLRRLLLAIVDGSDSAEDHRSLYRELPSAGIALSFF